MLGSLFAGFLWLRTIGGLPLAVIVLTDVFLCFFLLVVNHLWSIAIYFQVVLLW